MKKILLVFFFTSLVSNAQNISLLKEVATKNTDTIGAVEYSKQLLKGLPEYEFHDISIQAGNCFISFGNINDKNNDRIVLVFAPSEDNKFGFVEIRGFTKPILHIWKNNFNPSHELKTFNSDDRFKKDGLNFSFYVNDNYASIKDFT